MQKIPWIILCLIGTAFSPVRAEPVRPLFSCAQETQGQVACQANKLCVCQKSETDGAEFRWDCGILRPQCEVTPASVGAEHPTYPLSVGIDRSTHIVDQNQSINESSGESSVSE